MTENQFPVKRAEMHFGGKINEEFSWNVMFDSNLTGNTSYGTVLQDIVGNWKLNKNFSVKVGQFKFLQTCVTTSVSARDILFYDRARLSRVFGDKRDRGITIAARTAIPRASIGRSISPLPTACQKMAAAASSPK